MGELDKLHQEIEGSIAIPPTPPRALSRYRWFTAGPRDGVYHTDDRLEKHSEGEYIKYADHLTALAQQAQEVETLNKVMTTHAENAAKAVKAYAQEIERLTKNAAGQDVRINALRKYLAEYITKQHNAETALAAMTAERNAAETERIEWVLRAERAESLVEEIKEVRDEYHQQWMDALESEERGKAQLTASEQELMKVRAEKDEQWVKLCAAERKAVRLRETLEEIIRQCPYGATPAERNIAKLAQRALKGA